MSKLALITGAAKGIGAALAKRMASEGIELILVDKDLASLEMTDDMVKAAGGHATLVHCDLIDQEKIDALGFAVAERFGRLDILVGNAGVLGTLGPLTHQKPNEWAEVLNVNLTANWRLLRIFDPMLRNSPNGRAIFLTADVASIDATYWGAYAVSKAALERMVSIYAAEVCNTHPNLKVSLLDPGSVWTELFQAAMPGINQEEVGSVDAAAEKLFKLVA